MLILFWQFTIKTLSELDIVSNQHLSIEMFLIRLMHLSSIKLKKKVDNHLDGKKSENIVIQKKQEIENNIKTVDQIRNISQEDKNKPDIETEIKALDENLINSFDDLLNICAEKKEIKLKYKKM